MNALCHWISSNCQIPTMHLHLCYNEYLLCTSSLWFYSKLKSLFHVEPVLNFINIHIKISTHCYWFQCFDSLWLIKTNLEFSQVRLDYLSNEINCHKEKRHLQTFFYCPLVLFCTILHVLKLINTSKYDFSLMDICHMLLVTSRGYCSFGV